MTDINLLPEELRRREEDELKRLARKPKVFEVQLTLPEKEEPMFKRLDMPRIPWWKKLIGIAAKPKAPEPEMNIPKVYQPGYEVNLLSAKRPAPLRREEPKPVYVPVKAHAAKPARLKTYFWRNLLGRPSFPIKFGQAPKIEKRAQAPQFKAPPLPTRPAGEPVKMRPALPAPRIKGPSIWERLSSWLQPQPAKPKVFIPAPLPRPLPPIRPVKPILPKPTRRSFWLWLFGPRPKKIPRELPFVSQQKIDLRRKARQLFVKPKEKFKPAPRPLPRPRRALADSWKRIFSLWFTAAKVRSEHVKLVREEAKKHLTVAPLPALPKISRPLPPPRPSKPFWPAWLRNIFKPRPRVPKPPKIIPPKPVMPPVSHIKPEIKPVVKPFKPKKPFWPAWLRNMFKPRPKVPRPPKIIPPRPLPAKETEPAKIFKPLLPPRPSKPFWPAWLRNMFKRQPRVPRPPKIIPLKPVMPPVSHIKPEIKPVVKPFKPRKPFWPAWLRNMFKPRPKVPRPLKVVAPKPIPAKAEVKPAPIEAIKPLEFEGGEGVLSKVRRLETLPPGLKKLKKAPAKHKYEVIPRLKKLALDINLIPQELLAIKEKSPRAQAVVLLLAVILPALLVYGAYLLLGYFQAGLNQQISDRQSQISGLNTEIAKYQREEDQRNADREKILAVKNVLDHRVSWTKFFDLLEKYTLDGVYYGGITLDTTGQFLLPATADNYETALKQVVAFREAKDFIKSAEINSLQLSGTAQAGITGVSFQLKIALQDGIINK